MRYWKWDDPKCLLLCLTEIMVWGTVWLDNRFSFLPKFLTQVPQYRTIETGGHKGGIHLHECTYSAGVGNLSKSDYFCSQGRASHHIEDANIWSEECCPYLHWYMDQKTIYSLTVMAGRQLALIGTPVLQIDVYRCYWFYCQISVDTSMLLVQDFTLFGGSYKMLPSESIILIWMELMMLCQELTKGGSYCKGSASWVPLLVTSQERPKPKWA